MRIGSPLNRNISGYWMRSAEPLRSAGWGITLFHQDGVTGSEIRLSAKRFRIDESITNAEADFTRATYFYADWFEGAEKLDKALRWKSAIEE